MTQPIPYRSPDMPLDFPNRKGGLITFGILLICMGAVSGCMMFAMPLSLYLQQTMLRVASSRPAGTIASPSGSFAIRQQISIILLYGAITTSLIWTGIGSIRLQRWVRPIVLVSSVLTLVFGCMAAISMVIAVPAMLASMQGPGMSGGAIYAVIIGLLVAALIYVGVPVIFLLFYRSENVRLTLEYYDPVARWTDPCPITVLGMSIGSAIYAFFCLTAIANPVIMIFGLPIKGVMAISLQLALAALFAVAAKLIYHQRLLGWNLAVTTMVLMQISVIISQLSTDITRLAERMELSPEEIASMRRLPLASMSVFAIGSLIFTVAGLIFAIRIRRHFTPAGRVQSEHAMIG